MSLSAHRLSYLDWERNADHPVTQDLHDISGAVIVCVATSVTRFRHPTSATSRLWLKRSLRNDSNRCIRLTAFTSSSSLREPNRACQDASRLRGLPAQLGGRGYCRPLLRRTTLVALANLDEIHVRAIARDVHIGWAAARISHIAGEDHVFPIPADGAMRLRPVALHTARTSMR